MTEHEMAKCGNAHHVHRALATRPATTAAKPRPPETRPNPSQHFVCVLRRKKKCKRPDPIGSRAHPPGTNVPTSLPRRGPQYGNSVIEETAERAQRRVWLHVVPGNAKTSRANHRRTPMCDERRPIPTQLRESADTVILVSERIKEGLRPRRIAIRLAIVDRDHHRMPRQPKLSVQKLE